MNNNINNLRFNAVNFGSKGEKSGAEDTPAACDCPECREAEASADMALDALGRAQVKGPYVFDPKNIEEDLEEMDKEIAECLRNVFARDCYEAYMNEGMDADRAFELAQIAASCLNPNV